MTHENQPRQGTRPRPHIGKDHLILADWPLGAATYQQRRTPSGLKLDYAEYVVQRPGATGQRVILEAPSTVGLPAAGDKDFLIALLTLAKDQEYASDVVRFVPAHVLRVMDLATTKKNYLRLKTALKRLRAVTITYERAWYSRAKRAVEPILVTGILAEAKLVLQRGRPALHALPDSYVQWTRTFHQSLQEGSLIDLDLDLYFAWDRPGAKDLHRHLNKVWHGGRKPKIYERDLHELACAHLGMTDGSHLKRNFHELVKEHEQKGYLLPLDGAVRYRRIRPGVWRVRFDLHPDQVRQSRTSAGDCRISESPAVTANAAAIVRAYHCCRFGRETYEPKPHELKHAAALLRSVDTAVVESVVPVVAETVKESYRGQDCHFGAAVPYFELALQDRTDKERLRARQRQANHLDAQARVALQGSKREHSSRRTKLLAIWKALVPVQQAHYYELAVAQAASQAIRLHLRCHRDLSNPPTEVLAAMAADGALPVQ